MAKLKLQRISARNTFLKAFDGHEIYKSYKVTPADNRDMNGLFTQK